MRNINTQNPESSSKSVIAQRPIGDDSDTPLEHLNQNVEAIKALRNRAEEEVSQHQRVLESITAFFGRPTFLYSIILAIALWVTPNVLPRRFGVPRFDPPPFDWLERTVTLSSFLVTTGVLIKQNRQEKLAMRRDHLILQLGLLSEQKTAKLIALVEELRRDSPNVKDRHDAEAEIMQESTDPHKVMDVLEDVLLQEIEELEKGVGSRKYS